MRDRICEHCGEDIPSDSDFCLSCGAYLGWFEPESEPESERLPEPEPLAPAPPARPVSNPDKFDRSARPVTLEEHRGAQRSALLERTSGIACPSCSTENEPARNFCLRCGYTMPGSATTAVLPIAQSRVSWWERLRRRRRGSADRATLRAYRRSLPLRYRAARVGGLLVSAALLAALWPVTGGHPYSWARDRWDDLRNPLQPVTGVIASLDPKNAVADPQYLPEFAADGQAATAWGITWNPDQELASVPGTDCTVTPDAGLQLQLPLAADLRAITVVAGLPEGDRDRPLQWRPKVLQLRFTDGTCQALDLADSGAPQTVALQRPVSTSVLRVDVVDAYPPAGGGSNRVAISEITLQQRPPR